VLPAGNLNRGSAVRGIADIQVDEAVRLLWVDCRPSLAKRERRLSRRLLPLDHSNAGTKPGDTRKTAPIRVTPMKRSTRCAAVLLTMLALGIAHADTIEGRVVGITDGDTITLLDADKRQHKIRLDGIDAPESGQPYGGAAKRELSDLAFNQDAVAECSKVDRYGREVCRVLVDGADVCLAQIQAGMAWFFRRYAKELPPDRRERYADAEVQAKTERRGLWGDAAPVPPWEWRQPKRED
jgi:endonuclease YncB( thermonuclease family)